MVRSVNDPNVGGISRNVAEVFVNINSDRFIVGFCLMILNLLAMPLLEFVSALFE